MPIYTTERLRERMRWLPRDFSRAELNERFRQGEHKELMHQQVW